MNSDKIGFIGVGNMGEALIRGILSSELVPPAFIFASDINAEKLASLSEELGINAVGNNHELVKKSDIVLLAVKPDVIGDVLVEIFPDLDPPKWCISIAAGVSTSTIEDLLPAETPVVRVMPNTPAMVREGMSAICGGRYARKEHIEKTEQILKAVGKTVIIQEKLMDAVTALSGSGPAFIFLIIESLIDAGVHLGLNRADATVMATQTVLGASKMVMETGEHPAVLKNRVTSPAGTTSSGLYELERSGIRSAIISAVIASEERSKQISFAGAKPSESKQI